MAYEIAITLPLIMIAGGFGWLAVKTKKAEYVPFFLMMCFIFVVSALMVILSLSSYASTPAVTESIGYVYGGTVWFFYLLTAITTLMVLWNALNLLGSTIQGWRGIK